MNTCVVWSVLGRVRTTIFISCFLLLFARKRCIEPGTSLPIGFAALASRSARGYTGAENALASVVLVARCWCGEDGFFWCAGNSLGSSTSYGMRIPHGTGSPGAGAGLAGGGGTAAVPVAALAGAPPPVVSGLVSVSFVAYAFWAKIVACARFAAAS